MRTFINIIVLLGFAVSAAMADESPVPPDAPASPWAAITIFAIVIGMMAGIAIWRRRR